MQADNRFPSVMLPYEINTYYPILKNQDPVLSWIVSSDSFISISYLIIFQ